MNNLNSILIEGNLKADPQGRTDEQGKELCSFSVISNRSWEVDEKKVTETISVPCTTEGRLAQVCMEYLKKGRGVRVVGRLAGSTLYVHAEHVEFKPQIKKQEQDHAEAQQL